MAQKKPNKPTPQNTIITVILPEDGAEVRTGQIVVQRGTLAKVSQFEYTNLDDIMNAIQDSAEDLIALEQNPPPKLNALPVTQTPAQPAAPAQADSQPTAEQAEGDEEVVGEPSLGEEVPATPPLTAPAAASDQPTLF